MKDRAARRLYERRLQDLYPKGGLFLNNYTAQAGSTNLVVSVVYCCIISILCIIILIPNQFNK